MVDERLIPNGRQYPRVLIVYHCCINKADQHGVSVRGWFTDWPTDHLAQVYSGSESGAERFCGWNFKLGPNERRFGKLFFGLKSSTLGDASLPVVNFGKSGAEEEPSTPIGRYKRVIGRFLLRSGIWEVLFRPILSKELSTWIREFRPDIIYCQGYTLGFTWLPLMLQREFGLPICFQTGDDWPRNLYSDSPVSLMHIVVRIAARRLIQASTVRLSNGEAMSKAYLERYGVIFEPLMMCDDPRRFQEAAAIRVVEEEKTSILYVGSLGSERWKSLLELCLAAQDLQLDGFKIVVTALVASVPIEALERLRNVPNLQMLASPTHDEVPSYLKGSDVLFLPESFEAGKAERIKLSISTKAHLYMMSERPVLIYGHPNTGIMDYARRVEWGCRVEQQDRVALKHALRRLLTDSQYCHELIMKGREIAMERHDARIVREKCRRILYDAVRE